MPNFRQGPYTVKNAAKYVGKGTPKYRSGWELTFMILLESYAKRTDTKMDDAIVEEIKKAMIHNKE